ncbi:uncharacterized protein LOC113238491, partial [Hyposmocoma kahamanoa]|uniref:uncharacterized protein LOC113238491 n=1 Tax=Hyposmocoma kahamanoa TaxID=1477025 RepID=UPI000E6D81B9
MVETKENVEAEGGSDGDTQRIDLDYVLVNELGQFGRFQLMNILLVAVPTIMSAFMSEYIFSAAAIPHRCQIPECGEESRREPFEPEWLLNAVPLASGSGATNAFASCERYAPLTSNRTLDFCPANMFDQSATIQCADFVYERYNSVVYDFNLGCQEWYRALAGTLQSLGTLLVLP